MCARAIIVAIGAAGLLAPLAVGSGASAATASDQVHTSPGRSDKGVAKDNPRTIVTTDPELDDLNSMLRMLLYSNEIDIVGLVYSASQHHYEGDPAAGIAPHRWPDPDSVFHIDQAIAFSPATFAPTDRNDRRTGG